MRLLLPRSPTCRYGLAVCNVGLALLAAWLVTPLTRGLPIEIFFTAVILSLLFGRLGPGLLALCLAVLCIDVFWPLDFKPRHVLRLSIFSLLTLVIYFLAAARERLAARLRRAADEMATASEVQRRLFPTPPAVAGFDLAGRCLPASATGGDYFDFFGHKGGTFEFALGDVSGHGLGPALLAAGVRAYLRTLSLRCDDPGEVLTAANGFLCEDTSEGFVTVFLGRLDEATRTLRYASAGHRAYVLSAAGEPLPLDGTGPPLGVNAAEVYLAGPERTLETGQTLLLLSDGILEAAAPGGALFGLERALEVVRSHRGRPAEDVAAALCRSALEFAGRDNQKDDMTALVIRVLHARAE
jgi:serine phosphatase RsbU (regulator of sigma subunit)